MKIKEVIASLPIQNVDRALTFYDTILGFEIETLSSDLHMYWAKIANQKILLYQKEEKNKAEHTALSLSVENIKDTVSELEKKGIVFYKDKENKIFNLDGSLSAWFQDTEGNNLEISQRPK